jgi:hypothetical protein
MLKGLGHSVAVWVPYDRRKGQRRAGKRSAGVYAGLVLWGIYDRCTPALAAEVSLLAAMLGSLDEAQDVLADRGIDLDINPVRLIAYRDATRARLEQQIANTVFEDTVAGRRVVVSSDGGRIRLRETKRGPKLSLSPLLQTGGPDALGPGKTVRLYPPPSCVVCPDHAKPRHAVLRAAVAVRRCLRGQPPSPAGDGGKPRDVLGGSRGLRFRGGGATMPFVLPIRLRS